MPQAQQPQQQMTPEQIAELKGKIKDMSPEELKEFQKKQCIFCHIISGKVQSKKIFEDNKTLAILDINPANPGHILLMPKEHYSIMPQMPEEDIAHIFMAAKALSNAALRGLGVGGINIIAANGVAAGQRANHFMIHIIPRKENDGVNFELPQKKIGEKDLIAIRGKLAKKIASLTGGKSASKEGGRAAARPIAMPPKDNIAGAAESPWEERNIVPSTVGGEVQPLKPVPAGAVKQKRPVVSRKLKAAKKKSGKSGKRALEKKGGSASLDDIGGLFK